MMELINLIKQHLDPKINNFELEGYWLKKITKASCIGIEKQTHGYHIEITNASGAMNFFPIVTSAKYLESHESSEKRRYSSRIPLIINNPNLDSLLETLLTRASDNQLNVLMNDGDITKHRAELADLEETIYSGTIGAYNRRATGQQQSEIGTSNDHPHFLLLRRTLLPNDHLLFLKLKEQFNYLVYGLNSEVYTELKQFFEEQGELLLNNDQTTVSLDSILIDSSNSSITNPLNRILYGPTGTGKTFNSINHALSIIKGYNLIDLENKQKNNKTVRLQAKKEFDELVNIGNIKFITFHQTYSYEDFVEGIKPRVLDNGQIDYYVKDGIFKELSLQDNGNNLNKVLIIDEINRGNISKIFGELITLIEHSKRMNQAEELKVELPYSGQIFGVPSNIYLIGTMNTVDKSTTAIDAALRRRFNFYEYSTDYDIIRDVEGIELKKLLKAMNDRITSILDKEHQLGHTFFLGIRTLNDLCKVFVENIIPLLDEYFFGDYERLQKVFGDTKDWGKPQKYFIVNRVKQSQLKKLFGDKSEIIDEMDNYYLNKNLKEKYFHLIEPDFFKSIYIVKNDNE